MLVSKIEDNSIVSIKMNSGEEILGKLVSRTESSIVLDRPLMLAMTKQGMAFAPIMMTVDTEKHITFSTSNIMIIAETYSEIADQYLHQTTGIQPVTAGSIILP